MKLSNLEGKEEWGLKIYCNFNTFKEKIEKEEEMIKEMEKEIVSSSKGKAYFLRKKKDELIKTIINERTSEYTQDSFKRLEKVSLETQINKILPKEVTQNKNDMVLNVAFLIDKNLIKEFDEVLEYLKIKYSYKGLTFDCTGPWPPYNFCSIDKKKGETSE